MPLVAVERSGGHATARCTRTGSRRPTRRCRSSTTTRRSSQVDAGVPAGRQSSASTSSASCRRRGAGGRRARAPAAASRGSSSTLRRRRGVDELRRGAGVHRDAAPRWSAPLDKVDAARPPRRVGPRRRRGAHAEGRPLLPGRHGGRVRRLGRARGRDDDGTHDLLRAARSRTSGKGPVEPGAHFYRSLQLDEHGNPINKRNAWAARSVAYVRLIPPGAADTVHYRLDIPEDCGDQITLTAKVNYRKFAWWNTQCAYAGVRDPAATRTPRSAKGHDDGRWVFTGDTVEGLGRDQGDPGPADHRDGARPRRRCAVVPTRRAGCPTTSRSLDRSVASAGTTTASGCCCRATSRAPRPRS